MFAFVKFSAKCPRHDLKNILPVTKIRHFDAEDIDHRKYYNIKCGSSYCQPIIVCYDDTVEKVRAKVDARRQIVPPENLIKSASEMSSEECDASIGRSKEVTSRLESDKIKRKLTEKLEALRQKHVTEDTGTLVGEEVNGIEEEKNIKPDGVRCDEDNTSRSSVVKRKATVDAEGCGPKKRSTKSPEDFYEPMVDKIIKPKKPNSSVDEVKKNRSPSILKEANAMAVDEDKSTFEFEEKSTESREAFDKPVVVGYEVIKPKKPNSSADLVKENRGPSTLTEPNATAVDEVVLSKNNHPEKSGLDSGKKSTRSREAVDNQLKDKRINPKKPNSSAHTVKKNSSSTMTKDSRTATQNKTDGSSRNINSECNDASHLDFLRHIKNLRAKCSSQESTIAGQKTMIEELTTLNMELQRDVIQYFKEFKVMAKQYEETIRKTESCSAPPAGYISKKDGTIHLGHNVWIPYSSYISAVERAKTNQMFVKEIAVAVFGYDVLQNSSVTGGKSNKFKDKPAKPALDETKMLAISDIFRYRLRTVKDFSEYDTEVEVSKINKYISGKISDMNRPNKSAQSSSAPEVDDRIANEILVNDSSEIEDEDSEKSPIRVLEDEDIELLEKAENQHKNADLSAASDSE